ncbi:MAG: NAD/NADP octopine/nopaline dehydrogenase family protein [Mogibacterium sp.]|nr:NAD/NADP octopine/nopaline dehydrogenase family protein [Mogibacterium sp.]
MKITVVGGGNIGTQFAVHSAEKGHDVIMFTSSPEHFSHHLSIVDREGRLIHEGDICKATNNPKEAFRDADMIMITMPPTMMIPLAEIIYDNTDAHTMIGFVPGNGGFELVFKECIERGNILFGIDRVPAIARLTERGKTVSCSGYKKNLYIGALPTEHTETCAALIESIYDINCVRLPGFMALTLTPSNPILHTARLKTIFKDYAPGKTYDSLPLFYEEWNDESSELLLACDDEIQAICRALPDFGLEYVVSEREFYQANTPEELTRAISTEESLLGLTTPSVHADAAVKGRGLYGHLSGRTQSSPRIDEHMKRRNRWRDKREEKEHRQSEGSAVLNQTALIPDLHSRYFVADFPYGLTVIYQIGKIAGVDMPNIEGLLDWYEEIAVINDQLLLSDYGITNMEELRAFYLQ